MLLLFLPTVYPYVACAHSAHTRIAKLASVFVSSCSSEKSWQFSDRPGWTSREWPLRERGAAWLSRRGGAAVQNYLALTGLWEASVSGLWVASLCVAKRL
mmetsp:Transcript_17475/g.47370  ORF Transcript_17475/g.47370 Transcript_17475/m.47370 type:complete len:100 (+) Transcript_17475:1738-2037(+)